MLSVESCRQPAQPRVTLRHNSFRQGLLVSCCALALGLAAPPEAHAADITWDGSVSSDWLIPDNWVGGATPVLGDIAFFTDTNVPNQPIIDNVVVDLGIFPSPGKGPKQGDVVVDRGLLTIQNNGELYDGDGFIAYASDSNGAVTVTGEGSIWESKNRVYVGYAGNATLNIENGGKVSDQEGFIGFGRHSKSEVTVTGEGSDGEGSEWTNRILIVADFGEATLDIENGGKVTSRFSIVGVAEEGNGEITVTGDRSVWDHRIYLEVGRFGTGTVTIADGGTVSSGYAFFGSKGTGQGDVTVTGDGSEWDIDQFLTVGEVGAGTLTISDGGTVNVNDGTGVVTVASLPGSFGTVNIGAGVGETPVSPGTLKAGSFNFGEGTGTLNFNHTDESGGFEFTPEISGIGTINHVSGFTNFTGDSTNFDGTTNVNGGMLSVNNVLGGNVIVDGGRLEGIGQIGGLNVNRGTFAPGNSIGTMTVNGNLALSGAATFEVEVDAAGNSDQAIVNGTVDLTGATLRVLAEAGDYAGETDYTIIENDGTDAVVGTFGSISTNFAFLTPEVNYAAGDGNDVVLTLLRTVVPNNGGGGGGFCSVAETRNQCNVGEAIDEFPTDNPLFLSVLTQTAEGARQAFDALSGEVHATVAGTLIDDSRYPREAVMGRMMQAGHKGGALGNGGPKVAHQYDDNAYDGKSLVEVPQVQPLAFWTQAYGAWGTFDTDGNAATADRNLGGFISGMDAGIWDGWRVGLATGASFSDVSVDERYSGANTSTYHLGGYVGGDVSGLALRAGGLWAWSEIETSRAVVFPNYFERQKADYDADTGQLFGEIAYPTQMGGIELEPFGGFAYVSVETGGFREKGGPEASLRTSGFDQDVGYTTVGLRAAKRMMWGNMEVTPRIEAAWLHAFDDVTPDASLAFASTGIGFTVYGVPLAEDSALLDAGLDLAISDRVSAGVSYSGQYADNVSDNAVKERFTWLFN
ncbi:MAG: autotransporter domain-containing protein [Pseudomonadota bacterium]